MTLEKGKLGQPSGQKNVTGTRSEAQAELKTTEVAAFVTSCGTTILGAAMDGASQCTDKRVYKLLNNGQHRQGFDEACLHHSTQCTKLNANALSYAEAMLNKRSQAIATAYSNGRLGFEEYTALASMEEVMGSKTYKDLVLEASKQSQVHFCVLYEAMLCYMTAVLLHIGSPQSWPRITPADYSVQLFDLDPDYKGWL
jgi:hypothetical protein